MDTNEKPQTHLGINQIVHNIANGDRSSFRLLFDLYYSRLLHLAIYFLKSKEWGEEAVADVFYTIWKKRGNLSEIDNIEKYLYTSVKNQALHYIRRSSPLNKEPYNLYQLEWIADTGNPENTFMEQEYLNLIQQAVDSLPDKCREVFRLFFSDRLKQKEIAELLDISVKTVEAHISTAYKRIAEYVNKKYKSSTS